MRVSGIAIKQRETEIKALRLFVASSLVGSLVVHIGLLASGILNMRMQIPKPENEPIELTFIDPPIPKETKEAPKPEPPKPKPQKLEKIKPLLPKPETVTKSLSNPGGSSASSAVPEISEFKPQAPPKSVVSQTPRPKVKQIESPKPIQSQPQIPPKPVPQPQPTQEANEDLQRLLTQEKDSRTKPELSIPQTPIQEPQPTQKTNDNLRRLLAKQERNSRTSREFSPNPSPTQSPKATQADSKKSRRILTESTPSSPSNTVNSSPKIAANKDTSSRRRRRDFADNNKVVTAPTTPNPRTRSGTVNLTGGGDGRAACRRCRTSYPFWAKRKGVEGRITVALDADSQGNVTNVRLISSSGNNRLDQEHLKLARKWKLKSSSNGRKGVKIITNYVLQ
ncbi:MAG: TonB family protein [Cyanobacteria bacterium J06639_18]